MAILVLLIAFFVFVIVVNNWENVLAAVDSFDDVESEIVDLEARLSGLEKGVSHVESQLINIKPVISSASRTLDSSTTCSLGLPDRAAVNYRRALWDFRLVAEHVDRDFGFINATPFAEDVEPLSREATRDCWTGPTEQVVRQSCGF